MGGSGARRRKGREVKNPAGEDGRGVGVGGCVEVEEKEKREGERPTHRRMRPAAVFNWEVAWVFVSLGAAPPSIIGRRNTIIPALFLPSPIISFSILSLFFLCLRSLPGFASGRWSLGQVGCKNTEIGCIRPLSRVNPDDCARCRVLA